MNRWIAIFFLGTAISSYSESPSSDESFARSAQELSDKAKRSRRLSRKDIEEVIAREMPGARIVERCRVPANLREHSVPAGDIQTVRKRLMNGINKGTCKSIIEAMGVLNDLSDHEQLVFGRCDSCEFIVRKPLGEAIEILLKGEEDAVFEARAKLMQALVNLVGFKGEARHGRFKVVDGRLVTLTPEQEKEELARRLEGTVQSPPIEHMQASLLIRERYPGAKILEYHVEGYAKELSGTVVIDDSGVKRTVFIEKQRIVRSVP